MTGEARQKRAARALRVTKGDADLLRLLRTLDAISQQIAIVNQAASTITTRLQGVDDAIRNAEVALRIMDNRLDRLELLTTVSAGRPT